MQIPSGPPFSSERSSVFRAPGLGPGGRRWKSCRSDHFKLLSWPNYSGIRLLSGFLQVRFLPTAPLPGGVKVARRPVKPFGVGASPTLAAIFQGVMSAADGRLHAATSSERGGRRCNSCHPDHSWKAGRYKLAAPVLKTGSARAEVGALPTPSASHSPSSKGNL